MKKIYSSPTVRSISLHTESHLLTGSGETVRRMSGPLNYGGGGSGPARSRQRGGNDATPDRRSGGMEWEEW